MKPSACLLSLPLAGLVHASSALACSPPPAVPTLHAIEDVIPRNGAENVPADGVVMLRVSASPCGSEPGCGADNDRRLILFDERGQILGRLVGQGSEFANFGYWVTKTTEPLGPSTKYRVNASIGSGATLPSGSKGTRNVDLTFATAATSKPLRAAGGVEAKAAWGTHEVCNAPETSCGCPKDAITTVATRGFSVTVPAIDGGWDLAGYVVTPSLSENGDRTRARSVGQALVPPNQSRTFFVPQPAAGIAPGKVICFEARVLDPADRTLDVTPSCRTKAQIDAELAALGPGPEPTPPRPVLPTPLDAGVSPSPDGGGVVPSPATVPDHAGDGCNVSGSGAPGGVACGFMATLILACLRRRRRQRDAQTSERLGT